jgi:probable HAF family extracellular repeat protein
LEEQVMKSSGAVVRVMMVSLVLIFVASAAEAPKVTFTFTNIRLKGEKATQVVGINNAGVMVGTWVDSGGVTHGLMLKSGKATTIDDPKGAVTSCVGINRAGDIVGFYVDSGGVSHGFLHEGGRFTDVGPAGAASSEALGINDKGQIAGLFVDSRGVTHGFVRTGKQYQRLDVPGARITEAVAINDNGLVAVQTENEHANHFDGAIYNGKTYTMVDVPKSISSYPQGIDSAGDLVFSWNDFNGKFHGALRTAGGTFFKFDDPKGATGTYGEGINDHHVIVGLYQTKAGAAAQGFKASYK